MRGSSNSAFCGTVSAVVVPQKPTLMNNHLLFPEWQSYGEDDRVSSGSRCICSLFQEFEFDEVEIADTKPLSRRQGILGLDSIIQNLNSACSTLYQRRQKQLLSIGGTCGSEFAPVSYLNHSYGGELAVVWMDAHGDLNTPDTSPSGHFHGMVLRSLVGEGEQKIIDLLSRPLLSKQLVLAGTRDLDPSEERFISSQKIPLIKTEDLIDPETLIDSITQTNAPNVYVHLDLDVIDPSDFPYVVCPTPKGIRLEQLELILKGLNSSTNVVGLGIVECVSSNPDECRVITDLVKRSGITRRWS